MLDWLAHARRRRGAHRPDATVVFLGANDGFPLTTTSGRSVQCCSPQWAREYGRRARRMMASYAHRRTSTVYWLLLPVPRSQSFARVYRRQRGPAPRRARLPRRRAPRRPPARLHARRPLPGDDDVARPPRHRASERRGAPQRHGRLDRGGDRHAGDPPRRSARLRPPLGLGCARAGPAGATPSSRRCARGRGPRRGGTRVRLRRSAGPRDHLLAVLGLRAPGRRARRRPPRDPCRRRADGPLNVVFTGSDPANPDPAAAEAIRMSAGRFRVAVPRHAESGPLLFVTRDGASPGPAVEIAPVAEPFRRTGMWVWELERVARSPAALARTAAARGIGTVFVKGADGGRRWPQFSRALVDALHAEGISACAWQYVSGSRGAAAEARVRPPPSPRLADCFVIDAEAEYEGRHAAAHRYLHSLRRPHRRPRAARAHRASPTSTCTPPCRRDLPRAGRCRGQPAADLLAGDRRSGRALRRAHVRAGTRRTSGRSHRSARRGWRPPIARCSPSAASLRRRTISASAGGAGSTRTRAAGPRSSRR